VSRHEGRTAVIAGEPRIEQHVQDGRLGVKSGRGFYDDNEQRVAELTGKLYQAARQLADSPDGGSRR
jgi:3-hydroxyacyl-CoA dehydrogenase